MSRDNRREMRTQDPELPTKAVISADRPAVLPVLINQKHGGALLTGGVPGNRGGRPTNPWRAECAELADLGLKAARAKQILENPDHPAWLGALKFVSEQAYGKAVQTVAGEAEEPQRLVVVLRREI